MAGGVWRQQLRGRGAAATVPVTLWSPDRPRAGHSRRHTVDWCLWTTVETWSLIQGHRGKGIVWISLMTRGLVDLAGVRWSPWVQVKRETALWSPRAATQEGDPGGDGGAREAGRLDAQEPTQPAKQRGRVVGLLMLLDLLQIGLKLHLLPWNTGLDE